MRDFSNTKKSNSYSAHSLSYQFQLRHVFRAGAIIWLKSNHKNYYLVFRSLSRPNRGIQLPGGRIEKLENPGESVVREVEEETGIKSKIVCPLGFIYFENPTDNYSSMQLYYLLRPMHPINIDSSWKHIDKDQTSQFLECWFVDVEESPSFLSAGQDKVIYMFRNWLEEHKPEPRPSSDKPQKPNLKLDNTPLHSL
jgi:8-oxo-dGTP pyrophosphatase MutT (NUDIX family)